MTPSTPVFEDRGITLYCGDALETLRGLPDGIVQCCVTSPPYWGLRDYGADGQIGLEETPDAYVARLVAVFREVRRVLRDDGVLRLNLGDSYAAQRGGTHQPAETLAGGLHGISQSGDRVNRDRHDGYNPSRNASAIGLKHKDLVGIPWLVAFALRADGWYLRSDCIWAKPNPMPESVTDRPTRAHEYVFLLSKSARYFYDAAAIAEPSINAGKVVTNSTDRIDSMGQYGQTRTGFKGEVLVANVRNRRTVWTIATHPYAEAHFATYPEALVEPCILAGSAIGDTILDPFNGSGTTGAVAERLGRKYIGIELNPEYIPLTVRRLSQPGLFTAASESAPVATVTQAEMWT